jgi:hypothetical protein
MSFANRIVKELHCPIDRDFAKSLTVKNVLTHEAKSFLDLGSTKLRLIVHALLFIRRRDLARFSPRVIKHRGLTAQSILGENLFGVLLA